MKHYRDDDIKMISQEKFIADYRSSLNLYVSNKKHFFIINLLYTKYLNENNKVDDDIKKAKLNKLINTYIVQQSPKNFTKETYFKCAEVWHKASQYLETNVWLAISHLENDTDINSKFNAQSYCDNIEHVIVKLGLENISVYGNFIQEIVKNIKIQIKN